MSYITPNTEVRLLQNVPLDNDYLHTLWWANANAQYQYFTGKTKGGYSSTSPYRLTAQYYQRVNKNTIKVEIAIANLYDVNYLMFQNTAYDSKWFYAFITQVNYINDRVTEIVYEIDVLQTWFFDIKLEDCFVERQHSETDEIGDNIIPENVDLGEYVTNGEQEVIYSLSGNPWVIIGILDKSQSAVAGISYDSVYSGATLYAFPMSSQGEANAINTFLGNYIQDPDSVVCMYMVPGYMIDQTKIGSDQSLLGGNTAVSGSVTMDAITGSESLDGYTPKNKKMYTYPYNFYQAYTPSGQNLALRYEFFTNKQPKFYYSGNIVPPAKSVLRPYYYKNNSGQCFTESLSVNEFPRCSWSFDSFQAWISKNWFPIVTQSVSDLGSTALGVAGAMSSGFPLPVGAVMSPVDSVLSVIQQGYKASISANIMKGDMQLSSPDWTQALLKYYGDRISVTADFAESIDNYFTMFGYRQNKVRTPNIHARTRWTYVKTVGCQVHNAFQHGIPAQDDLRKITSIFDNGVTWWADAEHFGDYSQTNPIITEENNEA